MKTHYRIIPALGIIVLGVAVGALAQRPWDIETTVPEEPFSWVLFSYDGEADVNIDDPAIPNGRVAVKEIDAVASLPVATVDDLMLISGVGWQWNRFEFKDMDSDDIDLYAVTVPISLLYTGIDRWALWGNVTPGLFTDFDGMNSDDYRTTAHGLAFYRCLPNIDLVLGAAYDCEFGDDKLYPLGGAVWCIGEEWQLRMLFPMPQVLYAPFEKLLFFVDGRPAGNKWNLRPSGEDKDFDFKLESWRIGAGVEYELFSHIWLHCAAGAHVDRNYDIRHDNEKLLNSDVDDTYFVRAGLVVR